MSVFSWIRKRILVFEEAQIWTKSCFCFFFCCLKSDKQSTNSDTYGDKYWRIIDSPCWGVLNCKPKDKAGGQPLVGCPQILVHYTCTGTISAVCTTTTRLAVVTQYNNRPVHFQRRPKKSNPGSDYTISPHQPLLQWNRLPITNIHW
jgi:hypothetical protein